MKINYNGKRFKVVTNSTNGEISSDLVFSYSQHENIIFCAYSDAEIVSGHILGTVDAEGTIHLSYHQINTKNELKTGICVSTPEFMENGKIRIHEAWEWTSGDQSKGFSILEEL